MSREAEVVTYLRSDSALATLAPGGVYALSDLTPAGLTDPKYAEHVWEGGVFNTTILVREAASVPTGDLQGVVSQLTSYSRRIEVWGYGLTADAIEAALDRVYTLMMGKRLARAFSATWVGGAQGAPALTDAPELPTGIKTRHEDYRVVSIRMPAAV